MFYANQVNGNKVMPNLRINLTDSSNLWLYEISFFENPHSRDVCFLLYRKYRLRYWRNINKVYLYKRICEADFVTMEQRTYLWNRN